MDLNLPLKTLTKGTWNVVDVMDPMVYHPWTKARTTSTTHHLYFIAGIVIWITEDNDLP